MRSLIKEILSYVQKNLTRSAHTLSQTAQAQRSLRGERTLILWRCGALLSVLLSLCLWRSVALALPFKIDTPLYGARVWIDGVLRGHTPLAELELSAGLHVLELRWGGGRVRRLLWVSPTSRGVTLDSLYAERAPVEGDDEGEVAGEVNDEGVALGDQGAPLTELMISAELTLNDALGSSATQAWALKHPLVARRLYLEMEGVNVSLLHDPEAPDALGSLRYAGLTQDQQHELYARRLSLRYSHGGLSAELGRGPLGLLPRLRAPLPLMSAPDHLTLGEGSGDHPLLYADRATLSQRSGLWGVTLEAGRLTTWSAEAVRQAEGSALPYTGRLTLEVGDEELAHANVSVYGLSRLSATSTGAPHELDRWGATLKLELQRAPESIDHLALGVASAERDLLALLASGALELLGVMVRGEAELLKAHPLHQARAPWSLWPDSFEGDRARVSLSTEHIRWIEVKLASQGGGLPSWLPPRLTSQTDDYSGLSYARYISYPLHVFGPAYTQLSGTSRWRISLGGGELESSLTSALWASSPQAVEVTDPLTARLGVSWRSMDRGLISVSVDRGPLGSWGVEGVARLVFDVIGVGLRCDRPSALGLIPVRGLVSCGVDVSLLRDVQFRDAE